MHSKHGNSKGRGKRKGGGGYTPRTKRGKGKDGRSNNTVGGGSYKSHGHKNTGTPRHDDKKWTKRGWWKSEGPHLFDGNKGDWRWCDEHERLVMYQGNR